MNSFPLYATSPLTYAIVLLLVLILGWHWLPHGWRIAGVAGGIALLALMTPLGANTLARLTAGRAAPPAHCAAPIPDTIVVLGGGFEHAPRSPADYGALRLITLERVFAAVALWQKLPDAQLVVAGGAGWRIHEAIPMANLAIVLGVPANSIRIEDRSRTTWENARNVAALTPAIPRRIWLVTSAMHLPRALGAFRAWGFTPCAWPSRTAPKPAIWPGAFIPQGHAVWDASVAIHELVGSVAYAAREWWHARHPQAANGQTR